jgi:hypothetical protein
MNSNNTNNSNNANFEQHNNLPSLNESAMWFVPNFIDKKNKLEKVVEEPINKDELYNELKDYTKNEIVKINKELTLQLREGQLKLDRELLNIKNENLILRQQITELKESLTEMKLKHAQVMDEREKNRLIRANIPFSFYPSK